MKSGILAAETAFDAMLSGDSSADTLQRIQSGGGWELDSRGIVAGAEFPSGI